MPVGVQLFGESGTVQVDDNFASLALRSKGVATLAVSGSDLANTCSASVTVTGEFPIIAFRPGVPVALWYVEQSGSTWTFHFASERANTGQSFQWFVFDRPLDLGSHFGCQVFDASGRLTFDALQKYIRVYDLKAIDARTPQSFPAYGSRTWAVIMLQLGCVTPVTPTPPAPPPGGLWHWTAALWMSGVTIATTGFTTSTIAAATSSGISQNLPSYPQSPIGQVLLIDVTDF